MRFKDIINELHNKHQNVTKKELAEIVSDYEELVLESAKKQGKQRMKRMMVKVVERKARKGITPNGKEWKVPNRKVIVVKVRKSDRVVK